MAAVEFTESAAATGLTMRLFEAGAQDAGADTNPVAQTTALTSKEAGALLARLPSMEDAPTADFALREGPQPPPRTGATISESFPPPPTDLSAPAAQAGPVTVTRKAPVGPVPMSPQLSVSFNQPMIALSSQSEAAAQVPVKLSPQPPGAWRWLGTQTVVFDPEPRFPMATRYTVEVPAGTKGATGGALAAAETWSFETPPPTLIGKSPVEDGRWRGGYSGNPQPADPLIFLSFDQAITPSALVDKVQISGAGGNTAVRLATPEEIAKDASISGQLKATQLRDGDDKRAVVLRPVKPLPLASSFRVIVPAGTPSAEGPLTTKAEQSFSFRTYGPFRPVALGCWNQKPCPPTSPWNLEFTNPLDPDAFDPASITVSPNVPGLQINAGGNNVSIFGSFSARTTYTVTVAAGVKDIFGQVLTTPATFSISTGPAEATLTGPPDTFVVTDPNAAPNLAFFSINHKALKVTVYRVQPEDWPAWTEWLQKYRWEDARKGPLPGQKVASQIVNVKGSADAMTETDLDLSPWLKNGVGQLIVQVEPTVQPKDRWARQEWLGWVQSTKLGLTVFQDHQELTSWVTDLADGKPISGAALTLLGTDSGAATTGKDGLGLQPLNNKVASAVIARKGDDAAILPADTNGWGGGGWVRVEDIDQLRWFVFDDKNLYKPGETVHVAGWMRRMPAGKGKDLLTQGGGSLTWKAISSLGNPIADGTAKISDLGGFSFDLAVPATPNLGTASILLTYDLEPNQRTVLNFEIQEYRTPEFEVSTSGGDGVYTLGEDAFVDVRAAYYAGGGLANAPVTWNVSATPASFTPPNRSDWSFGAWSPWWRYWSEPVPYAEPASLASGTDANGEAHLGVHFESLNPARPMSVTAEATVMDVNRQAWTSSKSFLVHPAEWYVGLKTTKSFVESGKPIEVQSLVVDREGVEVKSASVVLSLKKLVWKRTGRGWEEVGEDAGQATVGASGTSSFTPKTGGSYALTATVRDPAGRKNETELRVWVSGGELAPDRGVAQEQVTLVPERESWAVGETATMMVQAPFFPADGVLTLRAGGILETRPFHMDSATTSLSIPITDWHVPDLTVAVDLVGAKPRAGDDGKPDPKLAKRAAYAAGTVTLKVPPLRHTLSVQVTPVLARLEPGGSTSIDLLVRDASGKPAANADLVVVAADQAVLSLTGYKLPDPLDAFYAARGDWTSTAHLRQHLQLANPTLAVGTGSLGATGEGRGGGGYGGAPGSGALQATTADSSAEMERSVSADKPVSRSRAKNNEAGPPPAMPMMSMAAPMPDEAPAEPNGPAIAVRSDFSALALWAPAVKTDAAGKATVKLDLPDNLTRYRIMVVAVSGATDFGSGEADVTARLPLMVRPSAPRFLNFGDRFELPIVVQNQTDKAMIVDVAVRASNASLLGSVSDPLPTGPAKAGVAGKRVSVPANDRVELRFPTGAALAGKARFQIAVSSGAFADAAELTLPVWTPATTEAFATYGSFDQGSVVQPVAAPADVWSQFGGLEITLSSTQLSALTDAFAYLVSYPYDCNEQIASRLLAIASLRDVLTAFGSDALPDEAELKAIVAADLEHLDRRQNGDGGFAFWRRGDPSWPYLSIHVAHAMVMSEAKGYKVDASSKARALSYLSSIERHIPSWYSQDAKWYLRGYALHVLALSGKDQSAKAKALLAEAGVDKLPAEAKGWILPILARSGATKEVASLKLWLGNHLTESAAGAHLVTSYADGSYVLLHSNRAVDGVWLDALLQTDPKNDLVPKLVNGLLANRKAGRWSSTTENAFILLALDRYFRAYESVTPDFVARAWLGKGLAGSHEFQGRQTDRAEIDVPMAWMQQAGKSDLVLGREGAGRLYYRVGMSYAPLDLDPPAVDYGFTVLRRYEAVDAPADVRQDADGSWHIRAGSRVRVKLTFVSPMRRYHVALVDPLPAGLEVLNPELKGTGALPADPTAAKGPYWWWSRTWYEHENFRDDRVEAFTSLLWDGVYDYSYVARATTPGDFVVPPSKAEEMYSPETFGRSEGDRVIIE